MKKLLKCGVAIATLSSIAFFAAASKQTLELSPTQLANIEALAEDEGSGEIVKCYCKINWFSPNVCSVLGSSGYCGGNPCSNYDGNCR